LLMRIVPRPPNLVSYPENIHSRFGLSKNPPPKRNISKGKLCRKNSSELSYSENSDTEGNYYPNRYNYSPTDINQNPPVLAKSYQINPSQINSAKYIEQIFPLADFILPSLDFVIPSIDDLLKLIPNITMKGIMGQLLDQYGRKFPAHEMILSCLTQSSHDKSPINVLDYNNPTKYETGAEANGQYIDVQFTRILVKPLAYALRSDFTSVHTNHLKTFTFSGKLPDGKWITIDERVNIYPLARPTAICVFFVNTKHYFQEFRITQTGPSHAGAYKFSLAGFDIHGDVIKNN